MLDVTPFPAAMATQMMQCLTLLLLVVPFLTVLRVAEGRPSDDADYLYKYDDLSPQVRNILLLLGL